MCGSVVINRAVNGQVGYKAGHRHNTAGQVDTNGHCSVSTTTMVIEELFLGHLCSLAGIIVVIIIITLITNVFRVNTMC